MNNQTKLCECGCGAEIPAFSARGEPIRFLPGHHVRMPEVRAKISQAHKGRPKQKFNAEEQINSFWSKVHKSDGCWTWLAATNRKGYGIFRVGNKNVLAHRFSYQIYKGEIPDGILTLHRCDNPACVNPAHLFLGTHLDNVHDCISKGRYYTGRHDGEHGKHKLTAIQVREIRENPSGLSHRALAKKYSVSKGTITFIMNNQTWRNV